MNAHPFSSRSSRQSDLQNEMNEKKNRRRALVHSLSVQFKKFPLPLLSSPSLPFCSAAMMVKRGRNKRNKKNVSERPEKIRKKARTSCCRSQALSFWHDFFLSTNKRDEELKIACLY
jgi:hypothetical protein